MSLEQFEQAITRKAGRAVSAYTDDNGRHVARLDGLTFSANSEQAVITIWNGKTGAQKVTYLWRV